MVEKLTYTPPTIRALGRLEELTLAGRTYIGNDCQQYNDGTYGSNLNANCDQN